MTNELMNSAELEFSGSHFQHVVDTFCKNGSLLAFMDACDDRFVHISDMFSAREVC